VASVRTTNRVHECRKQGEIESAFRPGFDDSTRKSARKALLERTVAAWIRLLQRVVVRGNEADRKPGKEPVICRFFGTIQACVT